MNTMITKNKHGFTLIELLVVIAIIGILSGMVMVSMNGARQKARDARRQSDMRQLEAAQQLYYGSNSVYADDTVTSGATAAITDGGTQLIGSLVDPTNDSTYKYQSFPNTGANSNHFCYYAKLEVPITMNGASHTYVVASDAGSGLKKLVPGGLTSCAPD